jgi:hypothetical protein
VGAAEWIITRPTTAAPVTDGDVDLVHVIIESTFFAVAAACGLIPRTGFSALSNMPNEILSRRRRMVFNPAIPAAATTAAAIRGGAGTSASTGTPEFNRDAGDASGTVHVPLPGVVKVSTIQSALPVAASRRRTASALSASDSGKRMMAATASVKVESPVFTALFTAPVSEIC